MNYDPDVTADPIRGRIDVTSTALEWHDYEYGRYAYFGDDTFYVGNHGVDGYHASFEQAGTDGAMSWKLGQELPTLYSAMRVCQVVARIIDHRGCRKYLCAVPCFST